MRLVTLFLMQSGVTATAPDIPPSFDLRAYPAPAPCSAVDTDDIVVCGRPLRDRYRLPQLDTARFESNGKAEISIKGNLTGAAEVESAEIAPGIKSNRMMLRLKLPF